MVSLLSQSPSIHILTTNPNPLFFSNPNHPRPSQFKPRPRRHNLSLNSIEKNSSFTADNQDRWKQHPRTLFPGGYKRPEIKVPNLVLQLSSEEVLEDRSVLHVIDVAVSRLVGIVVLNGGVGSGGRLYEAACLLKSVVRDRAYLLIAERVDIAAAVNASGVVLSDQGLPAIVARNTMMDSKSDSVHLPLEARNVPTSDAALNASNSEGADFLIYRIEGENHVVELVSYVLESVKVPIFIMILSLGFDALFSEAAKLLKSGASGLVISLEELKLFSDEFLSKLFYPVHPSNKRGQEKFQSTDNLILNVDNSFPGNKGVDDFIKLEDRERQLIEREIGIA